MPVLDVVEAPLRGEMLFQTLGQPSPAGVDVWRLDGAGIVLRTPKSICTIDPFLADGGAPGWNRRQPKVIDRLPPPSLVLVTHEHDDHTDPVALRQLAQTSCLLAGPAPSVEIARKAGFPNRRTIVLTPGMRFQLDDVAVTAARVRDDDAKAPLAYVITVGGFALYHGGDAQMSDAFDQTGAAYSINAACLSVAGKIDGRQFYLAPDETLKAARSLRAKMLIPIHWDLWTINGLPRSAWDGVLDAARESSEPSIALLDPGQRWSFFS